MARMTVRESIALGLREAIENDDSVFLMGEDIGAYRGAYAVTRGFLDDYGHERVKDTPISESAIVGCGGRSRPRRPQAHRGDHDHQLPAAGHRSGGQPRGKAPVHVQRPVEGPHGDQDRYGGRRPAWRDALPEPGGLVRIGARPEGRGAIGRLRRPGAAPDRHCRRQPGHIRRARPACTACGARCRTTTTPSPSASPR